MLDIGCGDDPVVPHAVGFDQLQGDANNILSHLCPNTFDCVHSSHCLEHMLDPVKCLHDWWALVRPGGFLITVVPDEDLYEQGVWPSLFNPDHKHTFRLGNGSSWSPVSVNLTELVLSLPGVILLSALKQTAGYVHGKPLWRFPSHPRTRSLCTRMYSDVLQHGLAGSRIERLFLTATRAINCPIDQTMGSALAQIEVVARKKLE